MMDHPSYHAQPRTQQVTRDGWPFYHLSGCTVVLVVEQNEGGGDDRADTPRAQADPPSGSEGGLEQRVGSFCLGAQVRVDEVGRLVVVNEPAGGRLAKQPCADGRHEYPAADIPHITGWTGTAPSPRTPTTPRRIRSARHPVKLLCGRLIGIPRSCVLLLHHGEFRRVAAVPHHSYAP